jgi:Kelch motif
VHIPRHIRRLFGTPFTLAGALCACIVLLAACNDDESPAGPLAPGAGPSFLISDGAHNALVGFYWYLPTLVKPAPPKTLTPDPDLAGLDPVVTIRLCSDDNCTSVGAINTQFTSTSITYSKSSKQYQVNWNTKTAGTTAGTYRIDVAAGQAGFRRTLGLADVKLSNKGTTNQPGQVIGWRLGSPFLIAFQVMVQTAGSVTIAPTTATINPAGSQQFTATLRNLHGALLVGRVVKWQVVSSPTTGVIANLTPTSGPTNASGQTVTTVTAGSAPGSATVYAVSNDLAVPHSPVDLLFATAILTVQSPNHDIWTMMRSMPTPRAGFGLAETGGILYAIGGTNGTVNTLRLVEAYNTNTDAWTTKGVPPTSRNFLSAAAINGIIYAVGGQVEGSGGVVDASQLLEAYDPATDMWITKADMPTGRDWVGVGAVNGILYAVGGYGRNTERQELEAYNPLTDTWTSKTPMPTPRSAPGVGVINGILYVVGGYDHSTGKSVTTVEAYDPGTGTWNTTPLTPMPTPRNGFGVAVIDGILYAIGGDNNNVISAVVEAYDPGTDKWTTKSSMTTPRNYSGAVGVNGIGYDVGGANDNGVVSTLEAYTP